MTNFKPKWSYGSDAELETYFAVQHQVDERDYDGGELERMRSRVNRLTDLVARLVDRLDQSHVLTTHDLKEILPDYEAVS